MGAADVRQVIADLARMAPIKFDPVRFRVIESMAARAAEQRESVRLILERKALIALADYQDDFASAQRVPRRSPPLSPRNSPSQPKLPVPCSRRVRSAQ
jgi:hypothetical protein